LVNVGLGYLTLDRAAATLSGGESQRIRLASQIGSELTGVIYILDEPSIGLHQRDNGKLLKTLKALRDVMVRLPLVAPVTHAILSDGFGYRYDPINGRGARHDGLDLRAVRDSAVYAPGAGTWLEVSSVSWFSDYQARRGDIRYKIAGQKGTQIANTLNGSALAVPRVWAAIMENFRQADGSVAIPAALHPYMRGATVIGPR
jgi:murein DD-endopeptidase MepM/ murein hydrolase activator NlpD